MGVSNLLRAKAGLRKLFIENGLGMIKAEGKTGITRQTLYNIINGKDCTPATVKKICDSFGVDVWDYFELKE